MRNIRIYNVEQPLDERGRELIAGAERFCVDYTSGRVYFLRGQELLVVNQNGEEVSVVSLSKISPNAVNSPVIILDFLPDSNELCLVHRSGHVFTVDSTLSGAERGCIVNEIHGGAWSPDSQILVVATSDQLISISAEFDTIDEVDLLPTHAGKEELQTIGWGSKETQFQGQAGKSNREKVDWDRVPTQIHEWDEPTYHTLVQWRADAQLLATSTVESIERNPTGDADGPREVVGRRIRVWDRELQLLSCCAILAGIEPTLALRPGKNLILTSRLFSAADGPNSRSLWFFEQNGQYRFNTPMLTGREGVVERLQWNADGSILMVVVWFENSKRSQVQFWTVSNADWTVKAAVDFKSRLVECSFSQEIFSLCYCLTSDGRFWKLEMDREYCCVDGVAVSVRQDQLHVSDFNRAPIPPPMSHCSASLTGDPKNEFVSSIALSESRKLAVFTSSFNLKFFTFKDDHLELDRSLACEQLSGGLVHGLKWTTDERAITFVHSTDRDHRIIIQEADRSELSRLFSLSTPIVFHVYNPDTKTLYFVDVLGVCKSHELENSTTREMFDSRTRNFHSWSLLLHEKNMILGLSPRHELVVNGKPLVQNCTSFSITSTGDFVLVTTFNSRLFVLSMSEIEGALASPTAKLTLCRGDGRLVERGAMIVDHEPGVTGTRCWLQMPRGNLEEVFPRDLLIERLKVLIDRREYRQVLIQMRRHRVNMNLIHDHDPTAFRDYCAEFVGQIDARSSLDVELLQLFVTALDEEDCTTTIFATNYSRDARPPKLTDRKVEFVCLAVAKELRSRESSLEPSDFDGMYTVILTCFVKPNANSAVDALLDLKRRAAEYGKRGDESGYARFLSNSLRHLCYIVPEHLLFDAALRTYDLEVVSMIADKQQKDPREYLPIIDELRAKSPKEYQNYCICLRLKDWTPALRHIAQVPERFDECLEHVKQHQLYADALVVFAGTQKYRELCGVYADFLYNKAKFGLAALFFEKCGNYEKSLRCHELDRNHREFMSLFGRLNSKSAEELRSNYENGLKRLVVQLEQHDQFEAAAEVLEATDLESNKGRVMELLVKGNSWSKAVECGRKTQTLTSLVDQLKARVATLMNQLSESETNFEKYQRRLGAVREAKTKQLTDWVEAQGDVDLGQSETMSEASSIASNMSRMSSMSTASARKRKNVQKKKTVIKEGSQYEDCALLLALKSICGFVDLEQTEMSKLLPALLSVDLVAEARELQSKFSQVLQRFQDGTKLAWPEFLNPRDLPGPLFELYRCDDGVVRMPEPGAMPSRIRLEEEMIPPTFRRNVSWKLELFD